MKKLYIILVLFILITPISVFADTKTLSLESDVVFVIDSVTAGGDAWDETASKISDVITEITPNGESLKIGAIIFRGYSYNYNLTSVNSSNLNTILTDIKDNAQSIETDVQLPANRSTKTGYNLHAGLLAADTMLASDTSVPNTQKYVIVITSGNTYTWLDNGNQVGIYITEATATTGSQRVYAPGEISYAMTRPTGSQNWSPSEGWLQYFTDNKTTLDALAEDKKLLYDTATTRSETFINMTSTFDTIDVSLLKSYEAYKTLKSKYHSYIYVTTSNGKYGESFVSFLNEGKTTTAILNDFKNDVINTYQAIEDNKTLINNFVDAILSDNKLNINSFKLDETGLIYTSLGKSYISSIYNDILQTQYKDKIEEFFGTSFYVNFNLNTTNQDNMYIHFYQVASDGDVKYQNKEVTLNFTDKTVNETEMNSIINKLLEKTQRIDNTDPENPIITYGFTFEDIDSVKANKTYINEDDYYINGDLNTSDIYKEIFTNNKVSYINYSTINKSDLDITDTKRSLDTVLIITYEGIPYKITDVSNYTTNNVIYIPDSISETTERYIAAALKRLNVYFEDDTITLVSATLPDTTEGYKLTINSKEYYYNIVKKTLDEDEVEKIIAEKQINKFIEDNFANNKLSINTINLDNYINDDTKLTSIYTKVLDKEYKSILSTYESSNITYKYAINYNTESTKEITFKAYKNTTNEIYTKTIPLDLDFISDIGDDIQERTTLINSLNNELKNSTTDPDSGEVTITHKVLLENLEYVGYILDSNTEIDILSHSDTITNKFKYNDYTYEFIQSDYTKDDLSENYSGYLLIKYSDQICGLIDNFIIKIDNIVYIPKSTNDARLDYMSAATTVIINKYAGANVNINYGGLTSTLDATTTETDYYKLSTTGKNSKFLIKKESLTEAEKTELKYLGYIDNLIDDLTNPSNKVLLDTIDLSSKISDSTKLLDVYKLLFWQKYKNIIESYQTDDYDIAYSITETSGNKKIKFDLTTSNYPSTISKEIPLNFEFVDVSTLNQTEINEIVTNLTNLVMKSITDPDTGTTSVVSNYTITDIKLLTILNSIDTQEFKPLDFAKEISEFNSIFKTNYSCDYIDSTLTTESTKESESGDLFIRYNGKVVSIINDLTIIRDNTLLIPDATEDTTDAYVDAANHRLNLYFEENTNIASYESDKYIVAIDGTDYEFIIKKGGLDSQEEIKIKSNKVLDNILDDILENNSISLDTVSLESFSYLTSDIKGNVYTKLFKEKYSSIIDSNNTEDIRIEPLIVPTSGSNAKLTLNVYENKYTFVTKKEVDITINFASEAGLNLVEIDNYMASVSSITEKTITNPDSTTSLIHEITLDDISLIKAYINGMDNKKHYIKYYESINKKFDETTLTYRYFTGPGGGDKISQTTLGAFAILSGDTVVSVIDLTENTDNILYVPFATPDTKEDYIKTVLRRLDAYYPNVTFELTATDTDTNGFPAESGEDLYRLTINGEAYDFHIEKQNDLDPDEALKVKGERVINEMIDEIIDNNEIPINSIEMTDVNTTNLNYIYSYIINEQYKTKFNRKSSEYILSVSVNYSSSSTDDIVFTYTDSITGETYIKHINKDLKFVSRSIIDETELTTLMTNINESTKMNHVVNSSLEEINRLNIVDLDALSLRKAYSTKEDIYNNLSGALSLSTDFNALFTNGYTYKSINKDIDDTSLYTWGGKNFIIYKDGTAVSFNDADFIITNMLYIPAETEDTTAAYITAATRRLKRSFSGSTISIRVGGDISDISTDVIYDETPADWTLTLDEYFIITIDGKSYNFILQKNANIINLSLAEDLVLNGYTTNNTFVSKFNVGESTNVFKNKLGDKYTYNFKKDIISTGDTVTDGNETFTVVLYGDLTGDGLINSGDLLAMRQHLLEIELLTGPYLEAAKIANRTTINSADLLSLRQHLLEIEPITQ